MATTFYRSKRLKAKRSSRQHSVCWIPTILMAAAAVEAFPNDLAEVGGVGWFQNDRPARLRHLWQLLDCLEDAKASQLSKYKAMHFAITGEPFPAGSEPFQSLKLLIDVRNKIMHPRPPTAKMDVKPDGTAEWILSDTDQSFLRKLEAKRLLEGDRDDWFIDLGNKRAAAWALITAWDSCNYFIDRLVDDPRFQHAWHISCGNSSSRVDELRKHL